MNEVEANTLIGKTVYENLGGGVILKRRIERVVPRIWDFYDVDGNRISSYASTDAKFAIEVAENHITAEIQAALERINREEDRIEEFNAQKERLKQSRAEIL